MRASWKAKKTNEWVMDKVGFFEPYFKTVRKLKPKQAIYYRDIQAYRANKTRIY